MRAEVGMVLSKFFSYRLESKGSGNEIQKPSLLLEFANQNFDTSKEVRLPANIDRVTLTVIDR